MRILFLILIMIVGIDSYGQSTKELDKRNGFKDIKLLTEAKSYPGLEFSKEVKDKPDYSIYKAKKGSYESIGDVKILKMTVYTYRDLIYKIEVTTGKNEQLFRSLEKAFGQITSSIASKNSGWYGEKVSLVYEVDGAKKVNLIYSSKEIKLIIAKDKKKDIDSLSSEF